MKRIREALSQIPVDLVMSNNNGSIDINALRIVSLIEVDNEYKRRTSNNRQQDFDGYNDYQF